MHRRGGRLRVFAQTRQWSGTSNHVVSVNGAGSPIFADAVVTSYDSLTGSNVLNATTMKNVTFLGMSFTSDITFTTANNLSPTPQTLMGAECVYIDSYTSGTNIARLGNTGPAPTAFLSLNEIGGAATVDIMPKRILYRRRFTIIASNMAAPLPSFGAQYTSAANVVSGFGTDRTIRKRARLGRQEAVFYRWEVYGVNTSAASNIGVTADFLGAVSYAFT